MQGTKFPVIYSTLDSQALVSLVLSQYHLGHQISCQFWIRGLSDVYLVTTPQCQYVLRVSHTHWRSRPEIEFELEYLNFLKRCGSPIAAPIATEDGQYLVAIDAPEGSRYATLFEYAPGHIPVGDLSCNQGHQLGITVAQMHEMSHTFQPSVQRPQLDEDYVLNASVDNIEPFLRHRPQERDELLHLTESLNAKLQSLSRERPYWTVCWGDPHSGNMHFTDSDGLTLFDFDQCGFGWRAFDIGKFLQISVRSGLKRTVRDAFMQGYESVAPLTECELDSLQAVTLVAPIWCWSISLHSAKTHNACLLEDSFFTQRIHQLKRLKSPEWQLF
ncbi:MAG: phosphotransferase [Cyanobacteria bacterium P01_F01_bin.42]